MPVKRQRQEVGGQPRPKKGRATLMMVGALAILLLSMALSACAPDAHQAAADQAKAKLDHELHHAKVDLGIPDSLLQPIEKQEQSVASGEGGFHYDYQSAESNYSLLYSQLEGVEQTAAQTLRKQVNVDVTAFTTALNARRSQGFIEVNAYQTRFDQAMKDYSNAKTPGDYAKVDATIQQQTEALNALWPAYQKLQDFQSTLHSVHNAGINASIAESEYNQDLQAFRDAASADRYQKLVGVIDGQVMQLLADETEAMPYVGSTMLASFQARINLLKRYGQNVSSLQQQHDQDAQELASAKTLADYLTLAQQLNKQTSALDLPLIRGKAQYDLNTLQQLINYAKQYTYYSSFSGQSYAIEYPYMDPNLGIGDAQSQFDQAVSASDFQSADDDTNVLITNLRAFLDNLHDATPHSQPHQTDLDLMRQYGIMSGQVVMVSLSEQTARFYENGKLVNWTLVTTGATDLPSPPGFHYAMDKEYHIVFKSSFPPGSPGWYAPTPINYAVLFANYGFFIHDAYWRAWFGPGSQFPHYDPISFNGGSHGCVNVPEANMAWIYSWITVGTPVVLY